MKIALNAVMIKMTANIAQSIVTDSFVFSERIALSLKITFVYDYEYMIFGAKVPKIIIS